MSSDSLYLSKSRKNLLLFQYIAKMRCFCLLFLLLPPIFMFPLVIAEDRTSKMGAFKLLESMEQLFVTNSLSKLLSSVKNLFSLVSSGNKLNTSDPMPEDAYLNIKDLTSKYGYALEEHKVQTEDGYILTLHRIPPVKNSTVKNVDVLLMHGLMDSSDGWVLQGPGAALAYVLADDGYNVWMGNARGNKYSSSHTHLSTTQPQFWKFSWEEIGVYDLPAMIDHILNYMKKKNLYYIGHSQGTTSFYVMASLKPAYNYKIKMMFSLSPVAFMGNVKSPIVRLFSPANQALAYWLSNFNIYSPSVDFFNRILSVICYVIPRCDNLLYLIVGSDHKLINGSLLPVVFSHMPSGSSTLQFVHYGQLVESGRFCRYDFGKEINSHVYGNNTPPDYELGKITVPIVMFHSQNDWLSDPWDVKLLISKLPNVIASYLVNNYNHLDFLYAINARDIIYSKIMERIKKYEYLFSVIKNINAVG